MLAERRGPRNGRPPAAPRAGSATNHAMPSVQMGIAVGELGPEGASGPLEALVERAAAGLRRIDFVWVALAGPCVGQARGLLERAETVAAAGGPRPASVGCCLDELVGEGREPSGVPAAAVVALEGPEALALDLEDLAGDEERVGDEIAARAGPLSARDLLLLWPDARGPRSAPLLSGLQPLLRDGALVAGVAAAGRPAPLRADGRAADGSLAAAVLRLPTPPRADRVPAVQPLTGPLEVTRARGPWILGLGGRPALDVVREAVRSPLSQDLARAVRYLKVGLVEGPGEAPAHLAIRNAVGFDVARRAISVPEPMRSGRRVVLLGPAPEAGRQELRAALERARGAGPAGGLVFGTRAWGDCSLFGPCGVEAGYLESLLPGVPAAGGRGAFQIASAEGRAERLTHASLLVWLGGDAPLRGSAGPG